MIRVLKRHSRGYIPETVDTDVWRDYFPILQGGFAAHDLICHDIRDTGTNWQEFRAMGLNIFVADLNPPNAALLKYMFLNKGKEFESSPYPLRKPKTDHPEYVRWKKFFTKTRFFSKENRANFDLPSDSLNKVLAWMWDGYASGTETHIRQWRMISAIDFKALLQKRNDDVWVDTENGEYGYVGEEKKFIFQSEYGSTWWYETEK